MEVSEKTIERFWDKVDKRDPEECWKWTGEVGTRGYGRLRKEGATKSRWTASRLSLLIHQPREVTKKDFACHTCDNPICVNPTHLYWGNNSTNQKDIVERGNRKMPESVGEKNGFSKLTEGDVIQIKKLIEQGVPNTHIGREFGVTHSNISSIKRGLSWTHI